MVGDRLERALPAEHAALLRSVLRTCANLRVEVARELESAGRAPRCAAAQRAASLSTLICILGVNFGQASREELEAWEEEAAGADGQHDVISHVSAPKLDALLVYGPAM